MDECTFHQELHHLKQRITEMSAKHTNQVSLPHPIDNQHDMSTGYRLEHPELLRGQPNMGMNVTRSLPQPSDLDFFPSTTPQHMDQLRQLCHLRRAYQLRSPHENYSSWTVPCTSSGRSDPHETPAVITLSERFFRQLEDLKAHLDRIESTMSSHHQEHHTHCVVGSKSGNAIPQARETHSDDPATIPQLWRFLAGLRRDVQDVGARVAALEECVEQNFDAVRYPTTQYTPPASVSSTQDDPSYQHSHKDDSFRSPLRAHPLHVYAADQTSLAQQSESTDVRAQMDITQRTNTELRTSNEALQQQIEHLAREDARMKAAIFKIGGNGVLSPPHAPLSPPAAGCEACQQPKSQMQDWMYQHDQGLADAYDTLPDINPSLAAKRAENFALAIDLNTYREAMAIKVKEVESLERRITEEEGTIKCYMSALEHNDEKLKAMEEGQRLLESRLVECQTNSEEKIERISSAWDEQVRQLHHFCEQKDAIAYKQEQIIARGAQLMQQRDEEIEMLHQRLASKEKMLENANCELKDTHIILDNMQAHSHRMTTRKDEVREELYRRLVEKNEALAHTNEQLGNTERMVEDLREQLHRLAGQLSPDVSTGYRASRAGTGPRIGDHTQPEFGNARRVSGNTSGPLGSTSCTTGMSDTRNLQRDRHTSQNPNGYPLPPHAWHTHDEESSQQSPKVGSASEGTSARPGHRNVRPRVAKSMHEASPFGNGSNSRHRWSPQTIAGIGRLPQEVRRGSIWEEEARKQQMTAPNHRDTSETRSSRHEGTTSHRRRHHRRQLTTDDALENAVQTYGRSDVGDPGAKLSRHNDGHDNEVKDDTLQVPSVDPALREGQRASNSHRHRSVSNEKLWWPPLPAPVRPKQQQEAVHRTRSMMDLRSVPPSSTSQRSLAKHQSMQRLPRKQLQAYVETEAEADEVERAGGSGGDFGGDV